MLVSTTEATVKANMCVINRDVWLGILHHQSFIALEEIKILFLSCVSV